MPTTMTLRSLAWCAAPAVYRCHWRDTQQMPMVAVWVYHVLALDAELHRSNLGCMADEMYIGLAACR